MHATTFDGAAEVAIGADAPVTPASTIKVLVAIEAAARFADGRLDPAMPVHLGEPQRTVGPVGLSLFTDDAMISARDLLVLMLTISDNVATDALFGMIGIGAQHGRRTPGHDSDRPPHDLRAMLDRVAAAAGFSSYAEIDALDDSDSARIAEIERRLRQAPDLDPDTGMRTSARDMTTLLRAIWAGAAGPEDACARVRFSMIRQVSRARIASGFGPGVKVAAKSGALLGVVAQRGRRRQLPAEPPYAVAVFTRTPDGGADPRHLDAAIGEAAALAVEALRG